MIEQNINKIGLFSSLILIISMIFFSCNEKTTSKNVEPHKKETNIKEKVSKANNTKDDDKKKNKKIFIKEKALIFFKIGKKDYKSFIRTEGEYSKYEFDALFSNFTHRAKSVQKFAKKQHIKSFLTTSNKIYFILKSGDTVLFNRKDKDLVLGQIFFNGIEKPKIEQGIIESKEFKKLIEEYYKLKETEGFPTDSIGEKADSLKSIQDVDKTKKDSLK